MRQQAARADQLRARAAAAGELDRPALLAELKAVREATVVPSPVEVARSVLEDWDAVPSQTLQQRLERVLERVEVFADRPEPLLQLHTTWGTVERFVGWRPQARPSPPALPERDDAGPAGGDRVVTSTGGVDPLQLLTPGEAARVARVTRHTLRSWDDAGRLPHTQASLGRGRLYSVQDLRAVRPSARHTGSWATRRARAAQEHPSRDATREN